MITLHQFQIFATVAKHLNVSNAAAELHVTQAAISNSLNALQKEYKTRLYKKNNHGIELTAAGHAFQIHVKGILSRVQKLNNDFNVQFSKHETQSLTVGGNFSASASVLPRLLTVFKKVHPLVRLNLRTSNRVDIEQMVVKSDVEIAVINSPPQSSHLASEPYRKESLVVFASRKHPLASKPFLTVRDLTRTPVIVRGVEGGRGQKYTPVIVRRIKDARSQTAGSPSQSVLRSKPNVALQCGTPDAVKVAVKNKLGIGVLFEANVKAEIRNGDFKKLDLRGINLEGQSHIIYLKDRPLSDNAQAFLALLRRSREKFARV